MAGRTILMKRADSDVWVDPPARFHPIAICSTLPGPTETTDPRGQMPPAATPSKTAARPLPFGLFSIPLGLAGLAAAALRGDAVWRGIGLASDVLYPLAAVAFLGVAALHLARPAGIAAAWRDPVQRPFAATATMSLLILSPWVAEFALLPGYIVWSIGAAGQLALTLAFLFGLAAADKKPRPVPSWLLILVGGIVAPQGAAYFGWPILGWFFFLHTVALWLAISAVVILDLARRGPLPPPMAPTLTILVAPPALATTAYILLTGGLDLVSEALLVVAVLMLLFVLTRAAQFARAPFGPPWWATTFPTGALAAAASLRAFLAPGDWTGTVATVCLILAALAVVYCAAMTVARLAAGRFLPAGKP
ncbi:MAG: hypothetical protein RLO50_01770 [Azospirillaceae bacterium]